MDPERLADYLAGELDAEERAELEAQLSRDPALRADLTSMERSDAALARLESPAPPAGFDERLHARLGDELDQILGSSTAAAEPERDELAQRRERRAAPRWLAATSAAAAALVVIAGAGVLLTDQLRSSDDELADGDAATTFSAESDDAPDAAEESAAAAAPRIVAEDRELDDPALAALVEGPDAIADVDPGLDAAAAATLRRDSLAALGLDAPPEADAGDDVDGLADDQAEAPEATTDGDAELERSEPDLQALRTEGQVGDDEVEAVARCLAVLLPDSPTAIPTYAELGTYQGEQVVAIGLLDRDPADGTLTRQELWILSRDGCEIRHIAQGDGQG